MSPSQSVRKARLARFLEKFGIGMSTLFGCYLHRHHHAQKWFCCCCCLFFCNLSIYLREVTDVLLVLQKLKNIFSVSKTVLRKFLHDNCLWDLHFHTILSDLRQISRSWQHQNNEIERSTYWQGLQPVQSKLRMFVAYDSVDTILNKCFHVDSKYFPLQKALMLAKIFESL